MSRPLRIQYAGAWYHVMNRGGSHRKIFYSPHDYEVFLNLLKESTDLWGIRIHAFSLLPNHYHFIVETPLGNLSRAMRHIDGVYTQRFNRKHQRDGHLFRGRYKSILIEEESYLVELLRYVHLNPVRSGFAQKPEFHRWTSHKAYLEKNNPYPWLKTKQLLSYFGRKLSQARKKLHLFVLEGVPEKLFKKLEAKRCPSVLSSKSFREWVEYNFVHNKKNDDLEYISKKPSVYKEKTVRNILEKVTETQWEAIRRPQGRKQREYRRLAVWAFRNYLRMSYREISERFGKQSFASLSRALTKVSKMDKKGYVWERFFAEIKSENVNT